MQTFGTIKCCLCGLDIRSNGPVMCGACLAKETDVTANLSKQEELYQCKVCDRWRGFTSTWLRIEPESPEMLSMCLKKIKNLGSSLGAKLVDAKFIWTEEHSRRMIVQVTVEPWDPPIIRQTFKCEFVVVMQMCTECQSDSVDQTWRAVVQIRQNVKPHRRTLLFLEQEILRLELAQKASNVAESPNGMDVYFNKPEWAHKFAADLQAIVPVIKRTDAKQLTGQDLQNSFFKYRTAICLEICPVCKDDLCLVPKATNSQFFGNAGNGLVLAERVTSQLRVVNVESGKQVEISGAKYVASPFLRLNLTLVEFVVLDVEDEEDGTMYVEVARERDFGNNDTRFEVRLNYGLQRFQGKLECGDVVLGYDLVNFETDSPLPFPQTFPQVVLVKKPKRKE